MKIGRKKNSLVKVSTVSLEISLNVFKVLADEAGNYTSVLSELENTVPPYACIFLSDPWHVVLH